MFAKRLILKDFENAAFRSGSGLKTNKKTTHIFQLALVVVGCAVGATHWHVDLRAHLGTF